MTRTAQPSAIFPVALLAAFMAGACMDDSARNDEGASGSVTISTPEEPVTRPPRSLDLNAPAVPVDSGIAARTSREQDAASNGGTLTFQGMGAAGWYPSRRDPASGQCDAINTAQCCMTRHTLPDEGISPWDEELILTLRGPMLVNQIVVYQGGTGDAPWQRVSHWEEKAGGPGQGIAFQGDGATSDGFTGVLGNKCLVDVSSDRKFPCGPGSAPFCPANSPSQRYGWEGSKLILLQASMPHFGSAALGAAKHCSSDKLDNWFDAPWIGLSHGELIRSGKFGGCHCYAKDPARWELADGCGQFNVFEIVNDNNAFRNLDVFSTNFFAYHGYVGEGPCGTKCDLSNLGATVDLIDKATGREAVPAVTTPQMGSGTAFRRPSEGNRWFIILMDAKSRSVQLAMVHPDRLPQSIAAIGTAPPASVTRSGIADLLATRLPLPASTGIFSE